MNIRNNRNCSPTPTFPTAEKLAPAALNSAFHADAVSLRLADQDLARCRATLPEPLPLISTLARHFPDPPPDH